MKTATDNALKFDQRAMRAKHFASQIMAVMGDFIPRNGDMQRLVYDELLKVAYDGNALIVNVPPEYDALSEAEAKRAMIDKMLKPFALDKLGD